MRVSIIIPVHNSEKYIVECLNSLIPQIENSDEVIVVENGSSDNTPIICKYYSEKYDFIKHIELGPVGVSAARNAGIEVAEGEWITFLDSDDKLLLNAFDVIKKQESSKYDVIVAGYSRCENCVETLDEIIPIEADLLARSVIQHAKCKKALKKFLDIDDYNNWSSWGKFFKRKFLISNNIKFPENVKLSEDAAFNFQVYCTAENVAGIKQKIYFYRPNENSVINTFKGSLVDNNMNLLNWFEVYKNKYSKVQQWEKEYSAFFVIKTVDMCLSIKRLKNTSLDKKCKIVKEICDNSQIKKAIDSSDLRYLINGKRNSFTYTLCLFLLRLKMYSLLVR